MRLHVYFIDRGKRKRNVDVEMAEVVQVAKKIASSLHEPATDDPNRTFTNYVWSRLAEMSTEVAREKRKKMLIILEDLD